MPTSTIRPGEFRGRNGTTCAVTLQLPAGWGAECERALLSPLLHSMGVKLRRSPPLIGGVVQLPSLLPSFALAHGVLMCSGLTGAKAGDHRGSERRVGLEGRGAKDQGSRDRGGRERGKEKEKEKGKERGSKPREGKWAPGMAEGRDTPRTAKRESKVLASLWDVEAAQTKRSKTMSGRGAPPKVLRREGKSKKAARKLNKEEHRV